MSGRKKKKMTGWSQVGFGQKTNVSGRTVLASQFPVALFSWKSSQQNLRTLEKSFFFFSGIMYHLSGAAKGVDRVLFLLGTPARSTVDSGYVLYGTVVESVPPDQIVVTVNLLPFWPWLSCYNLSLQSYFDTQKRWSYHYASIQQVISMSDMYGTR